jgi:hypothetical protein
MKRCEKISIINSIKTRGGQLGDYRFHFPHHHKSDKDTYDYSTDHVKQLNLTEKDIEKIIYNAFETAKKYVSMVNMTQLLKNKNNYSLPELSQFIKTSLSKSSSIVLDFTGGDSSEDDCDEDEFEDEVDSSELFNEEDQISPNISDEEEEEEGNVVAIDLSDTAQQNFSGCRIRQNKSTTS